MSETSTPPAGWYYDPNNAELQRYWNGAAWTPQVQPITAPPSAGRGRSASVAPPAQAAPRPLRVGLVVGVVVGVVLLLGAAVYAAVYATVTIPRLEEQRAHAADEAARLDVSALAVEVAHYHWSSNGFQPEIAVVDGFYAFTDGASMTRSPTASPGVEIGGVTGTGYFDWCVWVTAPGGVVKDFEYSLQDRLAPGRCGT